MLREVVPGKIGVAAVVIMSIPTAFCRPIPGPMLHHRDDTAGVQTIRAILYSGDVGFDHALRRFGIFTKGSIGARPPRFGGQICLWRERFANANRFIFLTDDISEAAGELR